MTFVCKIFGLICLVSSLVFFSSCSKEESGPIAAYGTAPLQAGKGLGDIALGTTLKDFVAKFGAGTPSYIASDSEAIQLYFDDRHLAFLFPIVFPCLKEMPRESWQMATKDLKAWMDGTPSCGEITLSSISVKEGGFYEGQTDKGVKRGDPVTKSYQHGQMYDPRPQQQILAGMSPDNPEDHLEYKDGILFHYTADNPNDIESTKIRRMTIFRPD